MNRAVALIFIAVLAAPGAQAAGEAPVPTDKFEPVIRQLAGQLTIPGVAYAVVAGGRVTTRGQFAGDEARGFNTETPLRFASVTKAFAAVLLMRAVEQKKLSLDDSASRWLPEFKAQPDITVRHLAAHVSEGVPGEEYVYGSSRYAKLGEILR